MFVLTVEFEIASDQVQLFRERMIANATTSLADEPGCRQFDVCFDEERPELCFLYEKYDDAAAFEAHKTSPHFLEFDAAVRPMVVNKTARRWTLG